MQQKSPVRRQGFNIKKQLSRAAKGPTPASGRVSRRSSFVSRTKKKPYPKTGLFIIKKQLSLAAKMPDISRPVLERQAAF